MKKIHKKGLALLCAFGMLTTVFSGAAGYFGGTMTANAAEAITISTAEELQKIGNDANYPLTGDYVLGADIDMSGIDFTPIGGGVGNRGSYNSTDANVFSGTFDGAGHVISNLTIEESGSASASWQYGLFGMIGSANDSDYASVKNLILANVDISVDMTGGELSLGALAGEVNHNATIDNIAVVNGTIEGNLSNGGDMIGVGGLIGEIRYSANNWGGGRPGQSTTSTNNVSISNVYVGADISAGSFTNNNYISGIVGRITKSNVTSMSGCVVTGTPAFKGSDGNGISGGDMTGNISNCYYVNGIVYTGTQVTAEDLKAAELLDGLSDTYWVANEGSYMLPLQCVQSPVLEDIMALEKLSIELEEGDSLSAVTQNFKVPTSIEIGDATEAVTWTNDAPEGVISVDAEGNVTVGTVYADTTFTLKATTESGKTKSFTVTILTKVAVKIDQEYAVVGEALTASMVEAPEGMVCTYAWTVDGVQKSTEASYTPTEADLMKTISVTATSEYGTYEAGMFFSKLPVVYVNTEGNAPIVSKEDYLDATLKIQGNATYNSTNTTLYDGITEIRGRGNTTWGYPKKPYKMKLDEKTDLFGFGANKHWVLLANYTDEAHMRNMLSYNLSGAMGMPYMQSVHVELVLNGEHVGLYQFCEQVKISKARVNIHDWEDYAEDVAKAIYKVEKDNETSPMTKDDRDAIEEILAETDMSWITSGKVTYNGVTYTISDYIEDVPAGTGGFLIELDGYFDEVSKFYSDKGQPLMFKSPEFINTDDTVMNYVKTYVGAFEKAIDAADFTVAYNGEKVTYSQLFDMDSLVQFWLTQELFNNVDAMKKSSYMYKDIDGLFYMGPIWDMDWSSNSLVSQYQNSGVYNKWQTQNFSDEAQANQWYKSIIKDPYFAVEAYELYKQMREEIGTIIADGGKIDTYQALLKESADVNTQIWYSGDNNKNFTTQTNVLKTYLTNRVNWFDTQFKDVDTLAKSLGYATAGGIEITEIATKDANTITVTASVTDTNATSVEVSVNGKIAGTVAVTDGKAQLDVPAAMLKEATDVYNTAQVFGVSADGSVIGSGNSKVTDFAAFYTGEELEAGGGNNTGGDNTGGDNTGGDNTGGDNTGGDNTSGDNTGGNSTGEGSGGKEELPAPQVTLSAESLPMQKGQKTNVLTVTSHTWADDNVAKWETSNPAVVTVNETTGQLKAKKVGTAVITVTMTSGAKAACTIKVQKKAVKTKKITVAQKNIVLARKKTAKLAFTRMPLTANDKVTYTVKNGKIAKVSKKGVVRALKKGKTKVTIKAGSKKMQITVTVK